MKVDINEVNYIAKLAKLKFTEEETLALCKDFESILSHFASIDKLDLNDIKLGIEDDLKPTLRNDEVKYFDDKKKLFQNTKSMKDTAIMVPKIIE